MGTIHAQARDRDRCNVPLATGAYAADFGGSLKDDYSAPNISARWSGFYIGGYVGYGWGDTNVTTIGRDKDGNILINHNNTSDANDDAPVVSTNSFDSDGWLGGIQLGYNIQAGRWVIGIAGDYSWADINGDLVYDPEEGPHKLSGGGVDWLAITGARRVHAGGDRLSLWHGWRGLR